MRGRAGHTKLIVDGILTTNGMTICTALGASAVMVAEPVTDPNVMILILKGAIPLFSAIAIKWFSVWVELRAHKAKLKMEADMKGAAGMLTGGGAGGGVRDGGTGGS